MLMMIMMFQCRINDDLMLKFEGCQKTHKKSCFLGNDLSQRLSYSATFPPPLTILSLRATNLNYYFIKWNTRLLHWGRWGIRQERSIANRTNFKLSDFEAALTNRCHHFKQRTCVESVMRWCLWKGKGEREKFARYPFAFLFIPE